MANDARWITRKEIAEIAGVSLDVVKRQERYWELEPARVEGKRRLMFYRRAMVIQSLRKFGLIEVHSQSP